MVFLQEYLRMFIIVVIVSEKKAKWKIRPTVNSKREEEKKADYKNRCETKKEREKKK